MAVAIAEKQVEADVPAVNLKVEYDYSRSGNNMVYNIYVKMRCAIDGGWRNNRWACKIKFNGTEVVSNGTVKAKTSGALGTGWYTYTLSSQKVAINSGSVPIEVTVADTGGSSSWSVYENWGTHKASLSVTAPSAPSAPASLTIPSSAAPDQTVSTSWSASSGGTNGVTGYVMAISKDGGSSWVYEDVSGTSKSLDLNARGFVHGSKLRCAIQSYSTVNGTRYSSAWTYSNTITTNFVAPSAPSSITIPSSIAPDKTASISWNAATGGTNGVKGYEWQWSNDGGNTWPGSTNTTGTTGSLNLNSNGFKHGSKLMARVRAYTTGQGTNYYSAWKTSGTTVTNFVAPSAPQTAGVSTDMEEPIPTGTYKGGWSAPASTGSNGISGYRVQWLKNGSNLGSEVDVSGISTTKSLTESDIQPGDTLSLKVRAYTIGQNTRYYSGYTTSGTITIVSDKFIHLSQNGGAFTKYKAYISVNGGSFVEIKKEKLKVIGG